MKMLLARHSLFCLAVPELVLGCQSIVHDGARAKSLDFLDPEGGGDLGLVPINKLEPLRK